MIYFIHSCLKFPASESTRSFKLKWRQGRIQWGVIGAIAP